ncbi:MAG TPA: AAA family ATPase, partial [Anaerolineales bacterium]|nr:AAA family ATPase [Anaerolineales bacterium]
SVIRAEPLNLSNATHLQELTATATNLKPDLIIIDTLTALFTLQSESDNAEVSKRVMRPLAKLACDSGAAVLLIHHIGKQSEDAHAGSKAYRGRGASAIGAFARLVLLLKPDSNDEQRVNLICAKSKGQRFDDVVLRLDPNTRWFANTGEAAVKQKSNYQLIVEFVGANRETKRAEIDRHMAPVSKASITRLLKSAVSNGHLQSPKQGWYIGRQNAHLLNAVDSKHSDIEILPNTHVPEVIATGEIGMAHLL